MRPQENWGGKPVSTLLWTNPSPNSSFVSNTYSMNLSGIKTVIIEYKREASTNIYLYAVLSLEGVSNTNRTVIGGQYGGYGVARTLFPDSDTQMFFGDCYNIIGQMVDSACIPYKIYGLTESITSIFGL